MIYETDFAIVASHHRPNVFFIFRECGSEVEVIIQGLKYKSNKKLTEKEKEFIHTEILK